MITCMKTILASLLFAASAAIPAAAFATTVDATMIPDGTYTVKVEKVQDPKHVLVMMQNGIETMLAARDATNFGSLKANQMVTISVVKGEVPNYTVQ
jgi:hypothetical protein